MSSSSCSMSTSVSSSSSSSSSSLQQVQSKVEKRVCDVSMEAFLEIIHTAKDCSKLPQDVIWRMNKGAPEELLATVQKNQDGIANVILRYRREKVAETVDLLVERAMGETDEGAAPASRECLEILDEALERTRENEEAKQEKK